MIRIVRSVALLWALGLSAAVASASSKMLDGYVTQISSSSEFEVGDFRVICSASTRMGLSDGITSYVDPVDLNNLHVGNIVHIEGTQTGKVITAQSIRVSIDDTTHLQDTALLEKAFPLTPSGAGYSGLLWIAGYPVQVTPSTHLEGPDKTSFTPDMIVPNTWVTFKARYTREGIIADSLVFEPNWTDPQEVKYREREQLRFTEPDYGNKKSGQIQFNLAPDFLIPADKELQQYVQTLGLSLVPDFQKKLPDNDPEKFHFRFFVMDDSSRHADVIATPSGDIFIPGRFLLRSRNESQFAFVLSNAIAWSLQRQQLQHSGRMGAHNALSTASTLGAFTPIGLPMALAGVANSASYRHLMAQLNQRADRIGLVYMEDSGYDLREAVLAQAYMEKHHVANPFRNEMESHPGPMLNLLQAISEHPHVGLSASVSEDRLKAAQSRLRLADPKIKD